MPKFLIDLSLDGYDSPEAEKEACFQFIEEQLDFSASSIRILEVIDNSKTLPCILCGTETGNVAVVNICEECRNLEARI